MRTLLWFDRDLRTYDHPGLEWLASQQHEVCAVAFAKRDCSEIRRKFQLEALFDLQTRLMAQGLQLIVMNSDPLPSLLKLIEQEKFDVLVKERALNSFDQRIEDQILNSIGNEKLHTFRPNTLLDFDQLPFRLNEMPLMFTEFRKRIEASLALRDPIPSSAAQFRNCKPRVRSNDEIDLREALDHLEHIHCPFAGGETAAFDRLNDYFSDVKSVHNYKDLRNGMIQRNHSTKLSPYLSQGSISAKTVFKKLHEFEGQHGKNDSTYWIFFELLWRDYFKFLSLKVGESLFQFQGLRASVGRSQTHTPEKDKAFDEWRSAQTSEEFINANMIELSTTGWMSNRGRQNVASYLSKTLNVDWTLGARYFEFHLIDYDIECNWGNWLYLSGNGTDPRDRTFNVRTQARAYDPDGEYTRKWLSK